MGYVTQDQSSRLVEMRKGKISLIYSYPRIKKKKNTTNSKLMSVHFLTLILFYF